MNLARPSGPQDEASEVLGDPYFIGVDERRAPNQLEPGLGCAGKNLRFRKGKAETRRGVLICPWMKGTGRTPWTEVYGGVVFSDPNQSGDWFIIAADGGVWKTRPNMTAQAVPLPTGVVLTAETFTMFVPNTDGGVGVLVLLRGPDADPLVCVNLDAGFSAVPASPLSSPTGTESGVFDMPRSRFGLNTLNRLLLIEGKDIVSASDILAYNQFIPVQNQYRINPGNSQALVRLLPMSNATLVCFKSGSVLVVTGVGNAEDGSLTGSGPDTLTESYGLAGVNAVVRKGSNAYWLTNEPSVTSLRLTELNETQDTDVRLSDALSQTFGRINSLYLNRACVEVWDGKLYVALPLDEVKTVGAPLTAEQLSDLEYRWTVVPGHQYYWATNGQGAALIDQGNDTVTITTSGWFTAVGTTVIAYLDDNPVPDANLTTLHEARFPNNGVAVFDLVTGAWCGVDEAPGVFAIQTFLKTPFLGRQRLFLLGTDGTIRLYEEGFEDEVFDAAGNIVVQAITSEFTTRGYQLSDGERARAVSAALRVRTWDPSYTITTLQQGYNTEQAEQSAVTRDRLKYNHHDRADWSPANEAADHATPGREDYSVTTNDPTGLQVDSAGVDCDAHQTSTDRLALSNLGDWQQLRITNTQGRLELLQVKLEQQIHERPSGVNIL